MKVRLRRATPDDAGRLATLGARLFAQTFGPANTPDDMAAYLAGAFNPARQTAELSEPERVTWLAEDPSGTAIGYAVLIRGAGIDCVKGERPAELRRIYVDLSVRRATEDQRVPKPGALLMDRCLDQARQWGCDVIWLAVWEENPRAIRFYEKNGFQKAGVKTFQLGAELQHDFVMARNL